jgi:hypothetical protein
METKRGNAPFKDFIRLESTLYTLTKRCMKTCKNFMVHNFQIDESDGNLYRILSESAEMDGHFRVCLEKCSSDYALLHQIVRNRFMTDLENVYNNNQKIYEDFYR